jgi:hypothetical protein
VRAVVVAAEVVTVVADAATRPDRFEARHVVVAGARRYGALRPFSLPRQRGRSGKPHPDRQGLQVSVRELTAPSRNPLLERAMSAWGRAGRVPATFRSAGTRSGHTKEPSPLSGRWQELQEEFVLDAGR